MTKPWKKVRVIVEVLVPPPYGYNQRHLKDYVEASMETETIDRHWLRPPTNPKVKRYSNVQAYETRVLQQKVRER